MMKTVAFLLLSCLMATQAFALKVGDVAPAVDGLKHLSTAGQLQEQQLLQTNHSGQFLVLEFFSITCSACSENLPLLTEISRQFHDRATFKLVSIDRNESAVMDFVQQEPLMHENTLVLDLQRLATTAYELKYTPTTFVVSAAGKIVFKHIGVFEPETMEELKLLLSH